jgi:RHS repeat-associated protein
MDIRPGRPGGSFTPKPQGPGPLSFSGDGTDGRLPLYEMVFRWYSPVMLPFLSRDPLGQAISPDEWLYTLGDPMNFVDRMGLSRGQVLNAVMDGFEAEAANEGWMEMWQTAVHVMRSWTPAERPCR